MTINSKRMCNACYWWEHTPQPQDPDIGLCCVNPPIPLPQQIQSSVARAGGAQVVGIGAIGLRPSTNGKMRCKEWSLTGDK